MYFSIAEKAKDIKEMAEKGVNAAKDKCKVQQLLPKSTSTKSSWIETQDRWNKMGAKTKKNLNTNYLKTFVF